MSKMCEDSTADDVHPARTDTARYCEFHYRKRRSLSSTASRRRGKARHAGTSVEIDTPTPGPRPAHVRAAAPAIPTTGDGATVVIAIPRETLAAARTAFAGERDARGAYRRNPSARSKSAALAAASLALSQAIDPILYPAGLPDG